MKLRSVKLRNRVPVERVHAVFLLNEVAKRKASQYTDSGRGGRAVNILNEVAKRKASQFHGHAHEGHARRSSMKLRSVKLRNWIQQQGDNLIYHPQ